MKLNFFYGNLLGLIFIYNLLFTAGCNNSTSTQDNKFISVTNIDNIADWVTVGFPLNLDGIVLPSNATNKTILWSVKNAGNTGAIIVELDLSDSIGKEIIGSDDYFNNSTVVSVILPGTITTIGSCAFYACRNLIGITIPDSVTSIGYCAFSWCEKLPGINLPNNVSIGGGFSFSGCYSLNNFTIPNGVTIIDDWTFRLCKSLTNITIPKNVTSIGKGAFVDCSSLASVTFEGSVTIPDLDDNSDPAFPGDLRSKYLSGGIGTYITTNPGNDAVWIKQLARSSINSSFY